MKCSRCQGDDPNCYVCQTKKPTMNATEITLEELGRIESRLSVRVRQLVDIIKDASQGHISPGTAAAQANTILSKIEDIAREAQEE